MVARPVASKPWLTLPISCEHCQKRFDIPLVVEANGRHHLELGPLKVTTLKDGQKLLSWAILCTDCLPSFMQQARERHPHDTIRVTEVDAKDAPRARKLLEESLKD